MPRLLNAAPIAFRIRQRDRDLIHQAAQVEEERPGDFARTAALTRAREVLARAAGDSVLEPQIGK